MALADEGALLRAMPAVFVLTWSTGFVVARFAMPHAPPFAFLSLRYALSVLAFGLWIALSRPAWPQGRRQWLHLGVCGMLIHAGYHGGVWASVKAGIGAGTVSLIVGLQPVLTALALAAAQSAQRLQLRQWLGLGLGLLGLLLVVWRKLGVGEVNAQNLALAVTALVCMTAGTLYQKRFVAATDVRTATAVQLAAALLVTVPLAAAESESIRFHPDLLGALAWSVLVLTLGSSSLLFMLLQRGAAAQVASLMYLVPPCTALLAWWLFDELLTPTVLLGMALAALGVALVLRAPAARTLSELQPLKESP